MISCYFPCNVTTTKFMCFVEKNSAAVTGTDDKIEYMNIASYLLETQIFLRKNGSVHNATISVLKKTAVDRTTLLLNIGISKNWL